MILGFMVIEIWSPTKPTWTNILRRMANILEKVLCDNEFLRGRRHENDLNITAMRSRDGESDESVKEKDKPNCK